MTKIDHVEIAAQHVRKAAGALMSAGADLGTPTIITAGRWVCEVLARELAEFVEREKKLAPHRIRP